MLACVSNRRKKDKTYITLKIDTKLHEDYVLVNIRDNDYLKVHVYFFDSLMTTIREFRTIKSCEFFPTASIILNPSLINEENAKPESSEKVSSMQRFIKTRKDDFNESQIEALDHVTKMKSEDFLLI